MRAMVKATLPVLIPALLAGLALRPAMAQTASSRVIGEVTGLNAASRQITLKTDKGDVVTVVAAGSAALRRVPPGVQDLNSAIRIDFSGIGVGDRVLAIGQTSADQKSLDARSVIVMSRSDLDKKRQAEHEDWRKRGVAGIVSTVDPERKTFTIRSGAKDITVQPAGTAEYRRYAPDSIQFDDSLPSSLAEIKAGDQLRALGNKSSDGSAFVAERIVSGSFRQIAATIVSLDLAKGEMVIKDLATRKTLAVRVTGDSTLRKLPAEMAATLARRYRSARAAAAGDAAATARPNGGADIGQTLERLPAMPLTDLKPGGAIMLSSTPGSDPARVTAVMLLAGVEPLLEASPTSTRDIMSGWNLGSADAAQ